MVQLDLAKIGYNSQKPMVFGVFATRKDTPIEMVREAHGVLVQNHNDLKKFLNNGKVIQWALSRSHLNHERLDRYFGEVFNRIDDIHLAGLNEFLVEACKLESGAICLVINCRLLRIYLSKLLHVVFSLFVPVLSSCLLSF